MAVTQTGQISYKSEPSITRAASTLELIQGSMSPGKVARQAPILAGLHRVVDGALIGSIVAVTVMSCFTLHWQSRWSVVFERLEVTRSLIHRFTESTAILERHFLNAASSPNSMVPTKVADLLYLSHPLNIRTRKVSSFSSFISQLSDQYITHGY